MVAMRTLPESEIATSMPRIAGINVPPLVSELILHACKCGSEREGCPHRHLIEVIVDNSRLYRRCRCKLPNLADPRAQRLAEI